jgi:hypothetical protein
LGAGLSVYEDSQQYDFVVHPDEILKAIAAGRSDGTAIGIYCPALGNKMYITGIDELVIDSSAKSKRITTGS